MFETFDEFVQSKDHRIETYEINIFWISKSTISLSCFDDKIYILNNGYGELALF